MDSFSPRPHLFPPVAASYEAVVRAWETLGVAFDIESPAVGPVDPERALLASLAHMQAKRKLLRLIVAWLDEFCDLIHVERLLALLRKDASRLDDTNDLGARVLGGVALRLSKTDKRWARIADECQDLLKGVTSKTMPISENDSFLVARDGADPSFKAFGWTIPALDRSGERFPSRKKLYTRDEVMRRSPWLRLRAAVGANWRADLLFAMLFGLAKNANQASRLLGCSYETAYRSWEACKSANATALFNVDVLRSGTRAVGAG